MAEIPTLGVETKQILVVCAAHFSAYFPVRGGPEFNGSKSPIINPSCWATWRGTSTFYSETSTLCLCPSLS